MDGSSMPRSSLSGNPARRRAAVSQAKPDSAEPARQRGEEKAPISNWGSPLCDELRSPPSPSNFRREVKNETVGARPFPFPPSAACLPLARRHYHGHLSVAFRSSILTFAYSSESFEPFFFLSP